MTEKRYKVLIVEDEMLTAIFVKELLEKNSYDVVEMLTSGKSIIEQIKKTKPNLILMDIKLKDNANGIELTKEIKEKFDIPIIYMTSYSDERTIQEAILTEPDGYVNKPLREADLLASMKIALHKHKVKRLNGKSDSPLNKTADSRKEEIINASVKLISEQGIGNFSMVSVAKELGLTTPALYRHFGNKRHFLGYLSKELENRSDEYFKSIENSNKTGIDKLNFIIFELCKYYENKNPLIHVLLSQIEFKESNSLSTQFNKIKNKNNRIIVNTINEVKRNPNIGTIESERLAKLVLFTISDTIKEWEEDKRSIPDLYNKINYLQKSLTNLIEVN